MEQARKEFIKEHRSVNEDVPVMCAHILNSQEMLVDKVRNGDTVRTRMLSLLTLNPLTLTLIGQGTRWSEGNAR